MTPFLLTFLIFIAAMLGAYFLARELTGWSRGVALRRGIVSPVSARSSHRVPTPRLGGLGLGIAYGAACAFFLIGIWLLPHTNAIIAFLPKTTLWLGLGWLMMVLTGLLDDIYDLKPAHKLALMALAALPPVLGADLTWRLPEMLTLSTRLTHGAELGAAVLWILFFTNGFNFMDGMDGFAASFALYASLMFFAIMLAMGLYNESLVKVAREALLLPTMALACWSGLRRILFFFSGLDFRTGREGRASLIVLYASFLVLAILLALGSRAGLGMIVQLRGEAYLLACVAMACGGFLIWNRPPARVFMGDGGSLGLGYVLAVYLLIGDDETLGLRLPLLSSLTVLMPFLFDVVLTLLRRIRLRQKLWIAHREHLYQRLMRAGYTHREVLTINLRRFGICGAAALLGSLKGGAWAWAGLAVALAVLIDYWQRIVDLERRLEGASKR